MFVLFQKTNKATSDGSTPRLEERYQFLGCRVHAVQEETGPDYIYLPVTAEVYGKFMMDPSMAGRYLETVSEYESQQLQSNVPVIQQGTDALFTEPAIPIPDGATGPDFAPVGLMEPARPLPPLGPRELETETGTEADCLIRIEFAALIRSDTNPNNVAPTFSVFGTSKDDPLDVLFDVQLSPKNPSVILRKPSLLANAKLWIRNPQREFTYAVSKRQQ